MSNKRIVIIFDECHRSQFGDNHKAIKEFFPKAQLFGFTGTPIFEENATYKKIDDQEDTYKTTEDIFQKRYILIPLPMPLKIKMYFVSTLTILNPMAM